MFNPGGKLLAKQTMTPALSSLEALALERMLRDELKRTRMEQLFTAANRRAAQDLPALTEAEVEQEIQAARAQRRAGLGNGR